MLLEVRSLDLDSLLYPIKFSTYLEKYNKAKVLVSYLTIALQFNELNRISRLGRMLNDLQYKMF